MPESLNRARSSVPERAPLRYLQTRFRFSREWITRPVFGFLLAGVAVAATVWGGFTFVAFLIVGCVAAAREWHRMFARRNLWQPVLVTIFALSGCLLTELFLRGAHGASVLVPYLFLCGGSMLQLPLALWRHESVIAHAGGILYIGIPALSLLLLRLAALHPLWLVLMLLIVIWATDTGALITGRVIGGPKLAPSWSPNKTWAGFIGGIVLACLGGIAVAGLAGARPFPTIAFSMMIAIAAQMGDLFESYIKRRIGVKNTGGLIPGHGGVLDRIDSSLFAAPLAAVLVLGLGLNPLTGVGP